MIYKQKILGLLVATSLLAGCQTTGSTGPAAVNAKPAPGPSVAAPQAPRPTPRVSLPPGPLRDALADLADRNLRPGPLLLHGGGGGRDSDGSDPFFAVGFFLSGRTGGAVEPATVCLIEAAKPEVEPFKESLDRDGKRFFHLGIAPENPKAARQDQRVLDAINRCNGFYFAGGDPIRLSISLLESNGADTPALAAIRQRHAQGALVFGASAGAMMASKTMLCECGAGSSLEALTSGRLKLAPGLRFTPNTLIDAHFLERGLIGRLVEAMRVTKEPFALGLDEDTAVLMPGDGSPWMILGESSVVTVRQTAPNKPYEELEINLLAPGDRYDPATRAVIVAPERRLMSPPIAQETVIPEIFAPGSFAELIRLAATNDGGRAAGISTAMILANIRFTMTRTPETKVYFSPTLPLERAYSITGLRLRVNAPITRRGAA